MCFQRLAKTAALRQNPHTGPLQTGTDRVTTDHTPLVTGPDKQTETTVWKDMVLKLQKQDSLQSGGAPRGTCL